MQSTAKLQTYSIDPKHSNISFSVRHLMITRVHGHFPDVSGTLTVPEGADVPTAVEIKIGVASIDTREQQRDAHLRSADFFDAEQHPYIEFRNTRISGDSENFTVAGDLTIHGVTKPVELQATFDGRGPDPWGNERVGYEARTKISRKEFGMTWNQALETGGVAVADEVKIELNVEAFTPKP